MRDLSPPHEVLFFLVLYSGYFYKTNCIINGFKLVQFTLGFCVRSVMETPSKANYNRLRHVKCSWKSIHGEEYIPVPLTWILILSEMGAAFLWENTHTHTLFLSIGSFCFSHFSFLPSTHLLFLLGLSPYCKMFFLSVKLLQVVSGAQPTECFLTVGTKRDRTWVLQEKTYNQIFE